MTDLLEGDLLGASIDANGNTVGNLKAPEDLHHAATKGYVDDVAAVQLPKAGGTTTGAIRFVPAILTDGPTITIDAAAGNNFTVTLAGNRTLASPVNPPQAGESQEIRLLVAQDSTGGRTLGFAAAFVFSTDLPAPVLSTAPGAVDVLAFRFAPGAGKWLLVGLNRGFPGT